MSRVGKMAPWRPILEGEDERRAREVIEAIGRALPSSDRVDPSLAGGTAGMSVFHTYSAHMDRRPVHMERALADLDAAIETVATAALDTSLYAGFTGVAWALTHLDGTWDHGDDTCDAIDDALHGLLQAPTWGFDYDLISGLVGFGVYALERLPRPSASVCVRLVVDQLIALARRTPEGVSWWTPPELVPELSLASYPDGYYNLGLAHGVPGVIVVLARACATGIAAPAAQMLLDEAVDWLLLQQLPPGSGSSFPSFVAPGRDSGPSRVAWCYGDLGVAAALSCAARCLGVAEWDEAATAIALRAAERRADEAGVVDAGLCHGAAGTGHIFNRFWHSTGDAAFEDAARYWLVRALDFWEPGNDVGGFSSVQRGDDGTLYQRPDPGLLTGAAGVGLALLAATSDVEPAWDRMLLISAPESGAAPERAR